MLNNGVGFCLVAAAADVDQVVELAGHDALVIGEVLSSDAPVGREDHRR